VESDAPQAVPDRPRRLLDPEMRWALGFVRPHARRLVLVVVLGLLGTGVALALPYLSKLLVDDALVGGDRDALFRIVGLFLLLTLLSFGANVASGLRYTRVSADVLFEMRLALYRHLQRLSPRFYARTPLGEIVSRINSDMGEIQRVVSDAALAWVGHVLFLVGAVVVMVWLDVRLFLVSILLLPLSLWALVHYRTRLEISIASLRARSAEVGTFLIETLQAMRLVTSSNAQPREANRFRERNDAFVESLMGMQRLRYLAGGVPGLLLTASASLVFLYGGSRVIAGTLTLGTFVAFMAYQMRMLGPIQGLMGLYANVATVRVSLRRVHEILNTPVEVGERSDPLPLAPARGEIGFEAVEFTFGRGDRVLAGVDLRIEPGERVAVVGLSGSGKSTLADLLVRNMDPDAGRILLDGRDLRDLRLEALRQTVFVVDQEPFLFHSSLLDNVRYARPGATEVEAERAVRDAGLGPLLESLPEGLHTWVGERGRSLSVGERQRVALARALLVDPAVLVLDESTGSLDPSTEAGIVRGAALLAPGRTTILITHRFELARRAERVVVLRNGIVAEEGPPEELLRRRGAFHDLMQGEDRAPTTVAGTASPPVASRRPDARAGPVVEPVRP
jgi:ATP-binding cassette, subfamily B, bacterial